MILLCSHRSSSGLLNTRKIWTWSKSSEGPQGRFKGWQHLTYREAQRAVTVQPREEKIQIQGDLSHVHEYLVGEHREGAARLS